MVRGRPECEAVGRSSWKLSVKSLEEKKCLLITTTYFKIFALFLAQPVHVQETHKYQLHCQFERSTSPRTKLSENPVLHVR